MKKSIHQLTREYVARTIAGLEKENKALKKQVKEAGKHPTCEAVLGLLNQASALLRERIGPDELTNRAERKNHIELLATAVGYTFDALRTEGYPFSTAKVKGLIQKAFMAGWEGGFDYRGEQDEKAGNIPSGLSPGGNCRGEGAGDSRRGVRGKRVRAV